MGKKEEYENKGFTTVDLNDEKSKEPEDQSKSSTKDPDPDVTLFGLVRDLF